MNKTTSKDVQESFGTNCSNRTDETNRNYEITHYEQRKSKLPCKVSPVCDLVKQSRKNSSKLLSLKREQKRKKDGEQGKNF